MFIEIKLLLLLLLLLLILLLIPEEEAVERLVQLIKENGDWDR